MTVDPMRLLSPQPTLVDQVYEAILAGISEGKVVADSRLIQEELAESLGVSRQPVQQAPLIVHLERRFREEVAENAGRRAARARSYGRSDDTFTKVDMQQHQARAANRRS